MRDKVLFVATVDKGHILKFHVPYLKYFKEKGFEVHVACAGNEEIPYCDKRYHIPFDRLPYKFSNFQAYKKLKSIIDVQNYNLIHCHTPVGGVIGRLASRKAKKNGTKILYTVHGFHFFKGAPLKNWLIYYPIEKWLSKSTDCLITINDEDYQNALHYKFKAHCLKKINGVGINLNKFTTRKNGEKFLLRQEYKYKKDDFILLCIADLNYNKNQELIINVVNELKDTIPNIRLLLAGDGPLLQQYKKQAYDLGLGNYVDFLGFRKDIPNLLKLSDLVVSASKREGLPVNIMEAMAIGLPIVATNCRGNRDLVINNVNGYLVEMNDIEGFKTAIKKLYNTKELQEKFGVENLKLVKKYSLKNVMKEMEVIYSSFD